MPVESYIYLKLYWLATYTVTTPNLTTISDPDSWEPNCTILEKGDKSA